MDDIKKFYFSEHVAKDIGVEEAIMLNNIYFWVKHNRTNNSEYHYYRDMYWMFNSVTSFVEQYPFWTTNQIRRILDNLIKKDYIIHDSFNRRRYDKTRWYTVTEKTLTALQSDTSFVDRHSSSSE